MRASDPAISDPIGNIAVSRRQYQAAFNRPITQPMPFNRASSGSAMDDRELTRWPGTRVPRFCGRHEVSQSAFYKNLQHILE